MNNGIDEESTKKKKSKNLILLIVIGFITVAIFVVWTIKIKDVPKKGSTIITNNKENNEENNEYATYHISSNKLEPFDTYFLKFDNTKKNKIYSPLAIKNGLVMLQEGTKGDSNKQISDIIGSYNVNKYENSKHLSLNNFLFIKDIFADGIKDSYINKLKNDYNAEIVYDSFTSPENINHYISEKSFNLINDMFDDISDKDFMLSNVLSIDMDWVNKIQNINEFYNISFPHKKFLNIIEPLDGGGYTKLSFEGCDYDVNAVQIGAVINRYDIIKDLGEDKIRSIVKDEYITWLKESGEEINDVYINQYLDEYITEIDNFDNFSSSTDFEFYVDDDVKLFAKDLKEYDGTTLQYIGIMPIKEKLSNYIDNIGDLNNLINNLKEIKLDNFKNGVITNIIGNIPLFKFDYEMDLKDQFKELGIVDVFDRDKADLSNLTDDNASIDSAKHKATIEFSNEGIKASAAFTVGGAGDAGCGFEYIFDVPVEKIDLTFDKPFLFLIRDKDSGEVWFTGTVYEPIKYELGE